MIEVRYYRTRDGKEPFTEWLYSLKDVKAISRIEARLRQVEKGNLGNYRGVGNGVLELKDKSKGPGYRLYCGMDRETLIIILCGGDKSSQRKDIKKAKEYWDDYSIERT